jgi:hypothetical protein
MTGRWPAIDVDHKNRKPLDNRWCNLREATKRQNSRNSVRPLGKTGVKGVIYRPDIGKYSSSIRTESGRISLGCFSTIEQAKAAYAKAAIKYHGEFANLGESNASLS